jgi:glycosyltransferase involved in cell wall biosynthesis
MRILFATTDFASGNEVSAHHVVNTCDGMAQCGHDVTLFHRGQVDKELVRRFPRVRFTGMAGLRFRGGGRLMPFLFGRRLRKLLAIGDFDWLVVRVGPFRPVMDVLKDLEIPICAFHMEDSIGLPGVLPVARKIALFVTNSTRVADGCSARYGIPRERSFVVTFSGIDPEVFKQIPGRRAVRDRHGLDQDKFLITHVSSFRPHHDFETLFQAVLKLDFPYQLVLIGEGSRFREIVQRASALGVNASFPGSLPIGEVAGLLSASDVCANPLTRECVGVGNLRAAKLWEYMASGVPVLETIDTESPVPEWAARFLALVPSEDAASMAEGFRDIERDAVGWRERAGQAREYALDQQNWKRIAGKCLEAMKNAPLRNGALQ